MEGATKQISGNKVDVQQHGHTHIPGIYIYSKSLDQPGKVANPARC